MTQHKGRSRAPGYRSPVNDPREVATPSENSGGLTRRPAVIPSATGRQRLATAGDSTPDHHRADIGLGSQSSSPGSARDPVHDRTAQSRRPLRSSAPGRSAGLA